MNRVSLFAAAGMWFAFVSIAQAQETEVYWGDGDGKTQADACRAALSDAAWGNGALAVSAINAAESFGKVRDKSCECSRSEDGSTTTGERWDCSGRVEIKK